MLPTPLTRDLFVSDVGPDVKGSKPGMDAWCQMPEKSGTDALLCVPLSAGTAVRAVVCAKPGVTAAAANVTSKGKFHGRTFIRLHLLASPTLQSLRMPRKIRAGDCHAARFPGPPRDNRRALGKENVSDPVSVLC